MHSRGDLAARGDDAVRGSEHSRVDTQGLGLILVRAGVGVVWRIEAGEIGAVCRVHALDLVYRGRDGRLERA